MEVVFGSFEDLVKMFKVRCIKAQFIYLLQN